MFENVIIHGIEATRYIASWARVGGDLDDCDYRMGIEHPFGQWLRSLTFRCKNGESVHMTEDEVKSIIFLASNGKLELQENAKNFLKNYKEN